MKIRFFYFTLFVTVFGAVSFLLKSCNPAQQAGISPEYAIVYNVLTDTATDNYEVFLMNLDGSGKTNITNLPGVEWSYISINNRVIFISDQDSCHRCYQLFETDFKGENPRKIADFLLADSWMSSRKNGTELLVKPARKVDSAFYLLNADGELLDRIVPDLPFFSDPLFVNDGKQVVFRGGQTRSKLIEGFNEELFIMNADGSNLKQLTHYPANDTTAGKFAYHAGPPKLHPVENFISYQSKQNGKYSLFAVSLDGAQRWKLIENNENEGWHDWSPDGKWLAIELFDDGQNQFNIGLMNWETKELKILTDTTYRFQQCPNFVLKN